MNIDWHLVYAAQGDGNEISLEAAQMRDGRFGTVYCVIL